MVLGFSLQTYFSIQHVQAAAYFARRAKRIEARGAAHSGGAKYDVALKGYATSSLFMTVAFLEALANELFADAAKPDGDHISALPPAARLLIAELGQIESIERASVLAKFDVLLKAAGAQPIPKNNNPAQDLATAIRLRNELVHYKAEWFDMGTKELVRPGNFLDSKLAQQIKGRFNDRPGPKSADSWLGSGCAKWSIDAAIRYTDLVFSNIGVKPIYDHVRSELVVT